MAKIQELTLFALACLFSSSTWAVSGSEIFRGGNAAAQESFDYKTLPPGEEVYVGYCVGLVTGFAEMIRLYASTEAPPVACIPEDVTVSMLLGDVVDFLDQNRSHWDLSASVLVLAGLKNSYLCD